MWTCQHVRPPKLFPVFVTIWRSEEAIAAWTPPKNGLRGGQRWYSNLVILTALTLRGVFSLPLSGSATFPGRQLPKQPEMPKALSGLPQEVLALIVGGRVAGLFDDRYLPDDPERAGLSGRAMSLVFCAVAVLTAPDVGDLIVGGPAQDHLPHQPPGERRRPLAAHPGPQGQLPLSAVRRRQRLPHPPSAPRLGRPRLARGSSLLEDPRPPNGWGYRCIPRQLSEAVMRRRGLEVSEPPEIRISTREETRAGFRTASEGREVPKAQEQGYTNPPLVSP